jgi:hypothetical protein
MDDEDVLAWICNQATRGTMPVFSVHGCPNPRGGRSSNPNFDQFLTEAAEKT